MRDVQLSSKKKIYVLDNIFSFQEICGMEIFCENSLYRIGASSTDSIQDLPHTFMQSVFSKEDVDSFGFFKNKKLSTFIENKKLAKAWSLAITKTDKFFYHTDAVEDKGVITIIYFVNRRWDKDWGGEMLFASDSGEAEVAVGFKPNRVIVFDSTIPHKPTPNAIDSPQYAYMFVAQFTDN